MKSADPVTYDNDGNVIPLSERFNDSEQDIRIRVEECEVGWYLRTNLGDVDQPDAPAFVDTELLGMAFEPEQKFENPDGTPIAFDTDYFGCKRMKVIAGPFADISDSAKKLW